MAEKLIDKAYERYRELKAADRWESLEKLEEELGISLEGMLPYFESKYGKELMVASGETQSIAVLGAKRKLEEALASATETYTSAASGGDVSAQALKAATQILQQYGLLERHDQAAEESPYDKMSDEELIERIKYKAAGLGLVVE